MRISTATEMIKRPPPAAAEPRNSYAWSAGGGVASRPKRRDVSTRPTSPRSAEFRCGGLCLMFNSDKVPAPGFLVTVGSDPAPDGLMAPWLSLDPWWI